MQRRSNIRYAALSDIGGRMRNEDAFLADRVDGYHVFAVADGLGGHAAGDVASRTAIEILTEAAGKGLPETEPAALLERAFQCANTAIRDYNREHRLNAGTTLSAAIVSDSGRCWIGTVGDSRTYIITPSSVWHTRDQSYVQSLVEAGMLSPEEAIFHPQKNILTRALGLADRVEVDLDLVELAEAVLVISSDGLHDYVPASTIQGIVTTNEPDTACRLLVDAARDAAGTDNITVIVMRS
ncbi:PP2C family protein-serine/threonine phosphatase [Methanoculleus sp.]|uniref:PP2C family protein-serine/threonine phosphatase n=1 Tax=Methanoculleus sp. TaxID=90427 RepID=UPI002FC7D23A